MLPAWSFAAILMPIQWGTHYACRTPKNVLAISGLATPLPEEKPIYQGQRLGLVRVC